MRQDDLARHLQTTQSSVSGWINGKYEPAAETVFAMETVLGLDGGHLSRALGYLPVEPVPGAIGVEGAIAESTLLDKDEKAALLGMYHVLVARKLARAVGDHERPRNDGKGRLAAAPGPSRARSARGRR